MADTLVKNPKLIVGTQSQVEAEMGANDIGFATDIEFYTAKQIDELLSKAGGASLPILTAMWSDHLLNDVSWLRADTFSWQSGDVYKAAYEHLASELTEVQTMYGWENEKSTVVYTYSATPKAGDPVVDANGTQKDTVVSSTESVLTTTGSYSGTSQWDRYSSYDKQLDLAKTETIGGITITYYQAQDGHKICMSDQESNIVALYEKTGAADYYLLDTTNKQFKLPRKQKRKLIQAVKNTNGTWYNLYSDGWVEQGGTASYNSSSVAFPVEFADTAYYFNANLDNGGTGTTLHTISSSYTTTGCVLKEGQSGTAQRALTANAKWVASGYAAESAYASAGMRLEYYYVGNFEQSAVEQTAGLNAELFNGKLDLDVGNAPKATKETIVGWGIPDYTAGVTLTAGVQYTASTDGVIFASYINNKTRATITINGVSINLNYCFREAGDVESESLSTIPVAKGDVYTLAAIGRNTIFFFPLKG